MASLKRTLASLLVGCSVLAMPAYASAKIERVPQEMYSQSNQQVYSKSDPAGPAFKPVEEKKEETQLEAEAPKSKIETPKSESVQERRTLRNYVSVDLNSSVTNIGGRPYETGVSLGIDGEADFKILDWLHVNPKFSIDYKSYGALKENMTENILDADLMLQGRMDLYSRKSVIYISVGGKYLLDNEHFVYRNKKDYADRETAGPVLSFGVDSRHLDFMLSLSEQFGSEDYSYKQDRNIRLEHANLRLVPRIWRFEMPASCEVFSWTLNNFPKDRHDVLLKMDLKPGISITDHLSIFGNVSYSWSIVGNNLYVAKEFGGGLRVIW